MVFAAASLREVVQELGQAFEQKHHIALVYNFAGSNTLAQQIQTAPLADVFLSADARWVDFLEKAGRTLPGLRSPFLSNRLVVISQPHSGTALVHPSRLKDAPFKALALANPEAVPAGRYAKAFLESVRVEGQSLWDWVKEKTVPTLDVRAALALVESDPAVWGIVYRTDAATSDRVQVLYEVPPTLHPPIVYWAAAIQGRPQVNGAKTFLQFLRGPEARAIYKKHGFVTDF